MAHKVRFQPPTRELGNEDVVFVVDSDGKRIGTLKVSKGGVVWIPRRSTKQHRVRWERFDDIMRDEVAPRPAGPRRRKTYR